MDELDLELAARLRTEPTPDAETVARHHRQLASAIQAAVAAGPAPASGTRTVPALTNGVDGAAPDAAPVAPLTTPRVDHGRTRSRRRVVALAAAAVAVLGGLLVVSNARSSSGDQTSTATQAPAPAGCGTELPFTFPAPAGFEGPLPGPSEHAPPPADLSPDTLLVHWQSPDATIDVRWPSSMPLDPASPVPEGMTTLFEDPVAPLTSGDRWAAHAEIDNLALGSGGCSGLDVTVTTGDADGSRVALDQVEMALAGPGGPLEPERPQLVTDTISAHALPEVADDEDLCVDETGYKHPNIKETIEGVATYATPREAVAFHIASKPVQRLSYQEIVVSDGSYGYAYHSDPEIGITGLYHVVPRDGGWAVATYEHTSC
jgi:hypothetical protein